MPKDCSFAEIESLVANAAKGSDLDWSMARSLAQAAVTLHRNNLDGCVAALDYLEGASNLKDPHGCPIRLALYILDNAPDLKTGLTVFDGQVTSTTLFAGILCDIENFCLQLHCAGSQYWVFDGLIEFAPTPTQQDTGMVQVTVLDRSQSPTVKQASRAQVSTRTYKALWDRSMRSFVPASKESRERGAGGAD